MADKTTESSVEFSLNQLMEIEADRARKEEAARMAKADEEARAAAETERLAREAEEARIAAEEQKRRDDEARKREEEARLAAMHAAEVEKARLDADNAARLEQMKASQHHEREKLAISQDEEKKKLKKLTGQISIALVAVALLGGGVAFKINSDKKAQEIRYAEELRQAQEQIASFQRKLADQEGIVAQKVAALAAAKDEVERAAAQAALDKAQKAVAETKGAIEKIAPKAGGAKAGGSKAGAAKAACNCQPGDPLCSCL
jgi:colicin import membrane protein